MRSNSPTKTFSKWIIGIALLVIGGVALLGWNYYQNRYPSWDEEVRLSDGRIITIQQKREVFDNYGTNQSWVTIDLPELGGKQVWHSYLMPQRVDVVDRKVYVFGAPRGDRQYAHYRYPKYFMVGFVWNANGFSRIPYIQLPQSIRLEENVYPCIPADRSTSLNMIKKAAKWCEPMGDQKQFSKKIDLTAYEALSARYSRRSGGAPISE